MTPASLLKGFAILFTLQWTSVVIIDALKIPFPAPLLGMLLLLLLLWTHVLPAKHIEDACDVLIGKMGVLFLPASVSIVLYLDIIKAELVPMAITIIACSLAVLCVTAAALEIYLGRKEQS